MCMYEYNHVSCQASNVCHMLHEFHCSPGQAEMLSGTQAGTEGRRGDGVPVSNINRWPVAGEKTPRVVCSVQQDGLHDHRDIV